MVTGGVVCVASGSVARASRPRRMPAIDGGSSDMPLWDFLLCAVAGGCGVAGGLPFPSPFGRGGFGFGAMYIDQRICPPAREGRPPPTRSRGGSLRGSAHEARRGPRGMAPGSLPLPYDKIRSGAMYEALLCTSAYRSEGRST